RWRRWWRDRLFRCRRRGGDRHRLLLDGARVARLPRLAVAEVLPFAARAAPHLPRRARRVRRLRRRRGREQREERDRGQHQRPPLASGPRFAIAQDSGGAAATAGGFPLSAISAPWNRPRAWCW